MYFSCYHNKLNDVMTPKVYIKSKLSSK